MKRLLIVALLSLGSWSVAAHGEVWLENLTWTELRDAVGQGSTTVIIPIGGVEQSGPHLALGKHNARVNFLADKIATQLGHTLVAPVVAYVPEGNVDPPTAHMKFPGTLTLTDETFIQMLVQTGNSLKHAGFTHVVFIGDHGGYQKDLTVAAARLNVAWGGKAHALGALGYYAIAQSQYVSALEAAGFSQNEIGTHAALADTSLELVAAPAMVRADKLKDPASAKPENGVYGGNPSRSTAALGQKGIDLIVAGTVAEIEKFRGGS
jgi:creatinine amidohydrolase/Fe(II)-dependent formamide hydrolase-like protein